MAFIVKVTGEAMAPAKCFTGTDDEISSAILSSGLRVTKALIMLPVKLHADMKQVHLEAKVAKALKSDPQLKALDVALSQLQEGMLFKRTSLMAALKMVAAAKNLPPSSVGTFTKVNIVALQLFCKARQHADREAEDEEAEPQEDEEAEEAEEAEEDGAEEEEEEAPDEEEAEEEDLEVVPSTQSSDDSEDGLQTCSFLYLVHVGPKRKRPAKFPTLPSTRLNRLVGQWNRTAALPVPATRHRLCRRSRLPRPPKQLHSRSGSCLKHLPNPPAQGFG